MSLVWTFPVTEPVENTPPTKCMKIQKVGPDSWSLVTKLVSSFSQCLRTINNQSEPRILLNTCDFKSDFSMDWICVFLFLPYCVCVCV